MATMSSKIFSKYFIFCYFLLVNVYMISCNLKADPSLELVQIIYRHGDRSPNYLFPTDVNNDYWTDGLGELTNLGKQQHYALGQYIRQRYAGFLNDSYNAEDILINSTNVDRTLMSAYSNLAGLYPPVGEQMWNPSVLWQPIPVHTQPEDIDYIIDTFAYCPKYQVLLDAVKASPEVQQINADNADLFAFVANASGYDVHDIFSLSDVYEALLCDKSHDLPVGSWVDEVWDQLVYLQATKFYIEYGIPQLARLTGGPMLGHMIDNMNKKINGEIDNREAFVFSTHDTSVVAFLSALGVWDKISPPYTVAIFVELHKLADGRHGVEVFYRNDTTEEPYILEVPNCQYPCPIEDLITLTQDMIPDDIAKECIMISKMNWRSILNWAKNLFNQMKKFNIKDNDIK